MSPVRPHAATALTAPGLADVTARAAAAFPVSGMDDAALIARVLDGDIEAFTVLTDRHYDDCARFAIRMLGNRQDAEDAMQETFLSVYGALGRYQERQTFRSWLFRVLINRCRSIARQRRRRDARILNDESAVLQAVARGGDSDVDLRDVLQTELDALEPRLREALLLKHGEGLEYREISALTGVGISALKMRVQRACALLRPRLRERLDG